MEELLACVFLYREGLLPEEDCRKKVDELFLADPENDFLLELEWNLQSMKEVGVRVWVYCGAHRAALSDEVFGRFLMARLREVYQQEGLDLYTFARRMYSLWKGLPPWLQNVQPFWTLCYADDPLSWGDEAQTRELYQRMLDYYEKEDSTSSQ